MPVLRADAITNDPSKYAPIQDGGKTIVRADDLTNGRVQQVDPILVRPRNKQVDVSALELESESDPTISSSLTLDSKELLAGETPQEQSGRVQEIPKQFAAGAAQFFVDQLPTAGSVMMLYGNIVRKKDEIIGSAFPLPGFAPSIPGLSIGNTFISLGDRLRKLGESAKEAVAEAEVIPDLPTDASSAEKIARDLGSGASSLAVSILGGLTIGPAAVGTAFGLSEAGQSFTEFEKQGKPTDQAIVMASALGFVEGGLEFYGLSKFLEIEGKTIRAVAQRALAEGVQELEQTGANGTLRTIFGLREWDGVDSLVDIAAESLYAGALGLILGFVGGGVIGQMDRAEQKKQKTKAQEGLVQTLDALNQVETQMRRAGLPRDKAGRVVDNAMQKALQTGLDILDSAVSQQEQKGSVNPVEVRKEVSDNNILEDPLIKEARKYATPSEFIDSMTKGLFYHGTKAKLANLSSADPNQYGQVESLYGPGLYLTDSRRVAQGYAERKGKGKEGVVLSGKIGELNLLDLEERLPKNVLDMFNKIADIYRLPVEEGFAQEGQSSIKGTDVYDEIRESMDGEKTKSEAVEIFQEITNNLQLLGYDGLKHIGGRKVKSGFGEHNVVILFQDPYTSKFKSLQDVSTPMTDEELTDIWNQANNNAVQAPFVKIINENIVHNKGEDPETRSNAERDIDIAIDRASGGGRTVPPGGGGTTSNSTTPDPMRGDDRFVMTRETAPQYLRRKIEDYNIRIKVLIDQVEKQLGPNAVKEANDIYLLKDNLPNQIGDMARRVRQRLREYISNLVKDDLTVEEVDKFLLATHAEERNNRMNERRKEMGKKPVAGLSGMTTDEANNILREIDADPVKKEKLKKYRDVVSAMHTEMLNMQVKAGLLTQADADKLNKNYRNYVPLFRHVQEEMFGVGVGVNIIGPEFMKAKGSLLPTTSITANIFAQGERVGARILKNQVGQAVIGLVKENPALSEIFEVVHFQTPLQEDERGELVPSDPDKQKMRVVTKELSTKGRTSFRFPSEMDGLAEVEGEVEMEGFEPKTSISYSDIFDTKNSLKEDWMGVKVDGIQYYVKIKDPGIRNAIKNIHVVKVPEAVRTVRLIMNIWSSTITRWNPEFWLSNFMRDFGEGSINLQVLAERYGLDSGKMLKDVAKNLVDSQGIIWRSFQGGMGRNGEFHREFDQFLEYGAATGHYWIEDVKEFDALVRDVQNEVRNAGRQKIKNAVKNGGQLVDDFNTMIELGTRFAVYRHLVANGISPRQAAADAGDLTINFSRQGEFSPIAKVHKLFFQPSIAGTSKLMRSIKNSKGVRKTVLGLTVGGALWALMSHLLDADGYEQMDDWAKNHRLAIPDGKGGFISFWIMPYGYTTFWALGVNATEVALGKKTIGEATKSVLNTALISFSPFGTEITEWGPSLTQPIVDIQKNEAWYDGPVRPEDIFSRTPKPNNQLYFKNASQWMVFVSQFLNRASGGSKDRSGLIDVSPSDMQYLFDQYGGGMVKFGINTVESLGRLSQGEFDPNKTPFVRQFYRNGLEERWTYKTIRQTLDNARKQEYPQLIHDRFYRANDRALEMELIDRKQHNRNIQDFIKAQYLIDYAIDDPRAVEKLFVEVPEETAVRLLKTYHAKTIRRIFKIKAAIDAIR